MNREASKDYRRRFALSFHNPEANHSTNAFMQGRLMALLGVDPEEVDDSSHVRKEAYYRYRDQIEVLKRFDALKSYLGENFEQSAYEELVALLSSLSDLALLDNSISAIQKDERLGVLINASDKLKDGYNKNVIFKSAVDRISQGSPVLDTLLDVCTAVNMLDVSSQTPKHNDNGFRG